jgi:hypothetical protein
MTSCGMLVLAPFIKLLQLIRREEHERDDTAILCVLIGCVKYTKYVKKALVLPALIY